VYIGLSTQREDTFRNLQNEGHFFDRQPIELISDNAICWNSTYAMLERAMRL